MLKAVLRLFSFSIVLFLFSCAAPRVEIPVYEGIDVIDVLNSKNNISFIETTFSIIFEGDDTEIKGEGVLNISRNGDLNLRVYSLGFLTFELTSDNGIIKSMPKLDRNKGAILTYGLRDCLFWWDIKDFEVDEKEGMYLLRNPMRQILINGKTMLPMKQKISLEDGRDLNIFYEDPQKADDIWYPSKIKIELSKYFVILKIKEILFILSV